MKAILLAAGLGTRLRPITDSVPKCLVPVGGQPLMTYWLKTLEGLGVEDILINLHYLAHQVRDYIEQSPYKDNVTLVHEPELIGTAGTLIAQRKFWQDSTTIVIHADNFCLSDLKAMVKKHQMRKPNVAATLLVFPTDNPQSCGIVEQNEQDVITAFHEKVASPPGNLASGAVAIFEPGVYSSYFAQFEGVSIGLDMSKSVLPLMVKRMQTWEVNNYYADIGTLHTLKKANIYVSNKL
jgi:mannose-1-phosphate guanylyltransferase